MRIYALRVNELVFWHFLKVMFHENFLEYVVINSFGRSVNCRKDTGRGPNKEGRRWLQREDKSTLKKDDFKLVNINDIDK